MTTSDGSSQAILQDLENAVLDHVAVAVRNLGQAQKMFEDLGLKFSPHKEIVEDQGVMTLFAPLDHHAHLELLQPIDDKSPVFKFMEKKGEGIHHICLKVADVESLGKTLKEKGYQLIYEAPVVGARNCLVNFIHPKSANGVLIEILQGPQRESEKI